MAIRLTAVVVMALLAVVATLGGSGAGRDVADSHVAVIVLENRELDDVIGNPQAPFLNRLAGRGALATRYYAIAHPSLPNHLAMLGGSTFGVRDNCTDCTARGPNLALQLSRAGLSWRAYMEGLPHGCFRGDSAGVYVKRHNPFMYFPSIAASPRRCASVVPATRLDADLRRRALPTVSWIVPGLCHGAHDCGIDVADVHLRRLIPRLTRQLGPRGFLAVTFDEGTTDAGCCGVAHGGRVATILKGPHVRRGTRLGERFTHYSLLATIEDALGLPRLRHARSARSLRAAFRR
jgi:phosphatidylinositol-3-phosphatase